MSEESAEAPVEPADKQTVVIGSYEQFEEVQAKLIGLNHRIDEANANRDRAVGRAFDVYQTVEGYETRKAKKVTDPLEAEKAELLQACTKFLMGNRSRLRRRFGKTITNILGTVKWDVRPATDTHGDTTAAVNFLRNRRGGKKYLRIKFELNKKALAGAPDDLRRALRRFGVDVGRFETLSMKLNGEDEPTTLARYRFPRHRHL